MKALLTTVISVIFVLMIAALLFYYAPIVSLFPPIYFVLLCSIIKIKKVIERRTNEENLLARMTCQEENELKHSSNTGDHLSSFKMGELLINKNFSEAYEFYEKAIRNEYGSLILYGNSFLSASEYCTCLRMSARKLMHITPWENYETKDEISTDCLKSIDQAVYLCRVACEIGGDEKSKNDYIKITELSNRVKLVSAKKLQKDADSTSLKPRIPGPENSVPVDSEVSSQKVLEAG